MKVKTMLLAVAAVTALAFAALPSIASAAIEVTPTLDNAGAFTSTSGKAELLQPGEPTVKCESDTNEGAFENSMTGTVVITFHKCTATVIGITVNCTTSGQPTGTIQTGALLFHLVYLKDENPGMLFTPPAGGRFAEFTCGGIRHVNVEGNGVLGRITAPGFNVLSNTGTITVDATSSGQEYTETLEGEKFGLEVGGNPAFENAGTDTVNFANEVELTE